MTTHEHQGCLFNSLFRLKTKKSSKVCTSSHLWTESTDNRHRFPCKRDSIAENVSMICLFTKMMAKESTVWTTYNTLIFSPKHSQSSPHCFARRMRNGVFLSSLVYESHFNHWCTICYIIEKILTKKLKNFVSQRRFQKKIQKSSPLDLYNYAMKLYYFYYLTRIQLNRNEHPLKVSELQVILIPEFILISHILVKVVMEA